MEAILSNAFTARLLYRLPSFLRKHDGPRNTQNTRRGSPGGGLALDGRVGCSYPDGQQTADGTIHLIWDFMRSKGQEIVMTTFREEDVASASNEAVLRVNANRKLVSKGGSP
jgi:hypothetical protein